MARCKRRRRGVPRHRVDPGDARPRDGHETGTVYIKLEVGGETIHLRPDTAREFAIDLLDECTSTPIQAGSASCWVWLVQHRQEAVEPTVIVDVPPNGGVLTLEQARDLRDAIEQLRQAVITRRAVPS